MCIKCVECISDVAMRNTWRICTNHDDTIVDTDIVDGIADSDTEFVTTLPDGAVWMLGHARVITIDSENCFPCGGQLA